MARGRERGPAPTATGEPSIGYAQGLHRRAGTLDLQDRCACGGLRVRQGSSPAAASGSTGWPGASWPPRWTFCAPGDTRGGTAAGPARAGSLRHLVGYQSLALQGRRRRVPGRSPEVARLATTPGGRLVFPHVRGLGEFERDLIRERTHAGLGSRTGTPAGSGAGQARLDAAEELRFGPPACTTTRRTRWRRSPTVLGREQGADLPAPRARVEDSGRPAPGAEGGRRRRRIEVC
ncbi:MAG: hypothetical protein WKF73_15145 [Nocardioidaceae bacterium]